MYQYLRTWQAGLPWQLTMAAQKVCCKLSLSQGRAAAIALPKRACPPRCGHCARLDVSTEPTCNFATRTPDTRSLCQRRFIKY